MTPRINRRRQPMDAAAVRIRFRDTSESHHDAVEALRVASNAATAKHLDTLLAAKTAQSYGDRLPSHADASRLVLHARRLVDAAESTLTT